MAPTAPSAPVAAAVSVYPTNNAPAPLPIRSYEPKDNKAVCSLFADGMFLYRPSEEEDAFLYHDLTNYVERCFHGDLANIEKVYMGSGGHFWVVPATDAATGHEEIAAMIAFEGKGNGVGELRRLSVSSKYRRLGLGERLVLHVEQWALANGYQTIQLSTDTTMTPALQLYERLGYKRTRHDTIREDPPHYQFWFRKALV